MCAPEIQFCLVSCHCIFLVGLMCGFSLFLSLICGQFVVFYIYQRCSGLTLKSILRKYFNPQAKIMNYVLVRYFVKMHYQFSAKVMDPNFIRCVAKERNRV